jgi:uncharacterized protein (DUF2141 family)
MKHRLLYIPILLLFLLSFVDCAKKGSPSGGKRDSIPPIIVKSSPENYAINFSDNEIRIYFNEYIKLKDVQKELIVSPPLKYAPIITPLSASKVLKIKISDTLKENTTYSFNFGKSIQDNNEGNPFEYFKYVFSTGTYIDSLKLLGTIADAVLLKPENGTTVLLHEVNETFKDSLVFSEKPTYVTVTDSTKAFEFTNLKAGKYLLLALKEKNNDYTFQPANDKIAYADSIISLPTNNSYQLSLFKEDPEYQIARANHQTKNHITFGFQGDGEDLEIKLESEAPEKFEHRIYKDFKSDTLHYWFKPEIEADSLIFTAKNHDKIDTLNVRMRDLFSDSLRFSTIKSGVLTLKDTLQLIANTPIVSVDSEKIFVMNKDSVTVKANLFLNPKYNITHVIFEKSEDQLYKIQILPDAITDFYEATNDTLKYVVTTKALSDYGSLALTLNNVNAFPIIVQLVDSKFKVLSEEFITENSPVQFNYISPGDYYVRIVYDGNGNKKWDTGNFLQRLAPEKIVYYPSKIEVRANWSLNEIFTLD